MGITIDGYSGKPVAVVSTEGGVLIEETAKHSPDKIASVKIDPKLGFYPYQAQKLLRQLGLAPKPLTACSDILVRLYKVFEKYEAIIVEINPLVILENGGLMAVDAVLEIDDSALFRLKKSLSLPTDNRLGNSLENKGKEIGVTYVDLEGDIGLISSGAGLGMASMDIIGNKLNPANFLETGGGITAELLYKCMELILMKDLKAIFINIYGGINPIHEGAKGIVKYIKDHHVTLPIVAKALGNHQEETWEILKSGGVHVVTQAATETAVDKLIDLLK
jgi:succinyl-CoA synthetase beta subunit